MKNAWMDLTDPMLLRAVGERLARLRLERNMTQLELAKSAGVSSMTVRRLERGDAVSFELVLRVLRALELLDRLEAAIPEETIRPIEIVDRHGRRRQRASGRASSPKHERGGVRWTWGDEPGSGS
jgi:transcriptional regulator with XRE-family HTH domain